MGAVAHARETAATRRVVRSEEASGLVPRTQVVVVGAGLAGLAAARELADAGGDVTVIDARDRVGGRVWSVELSNGEIAELGAEWMMPDDAEVRRWAARFEVALAASGVDYLRRVAGGPGAAGIDEQEAFLAAASDALAAMAREEIAGLSAGAFLSALDAPDAGRLAVCMRLQGTCATDLRGVALRSLAAGDAFAPPSTAPYVRMAGGNGSLPAAIARSLPDVRLGTPARAVVHDATGVRVELEGGSSVEAQAAIVAVPARIAARLRFDPYLPEDLAIALRELPMGVAAKLAVPLDGEPTPRAVQSTELPFWSWAARAADGTMRRCLTSFAGSDLAREGLDAASGDPGVWLDRLGALHPDLELGGGAVMHDWAGDPLALGAYSAWDNRSWDRIGEFERTVGRLAFAGEHTAGPEHHGTMEGALRSGVRAARQVLEMVG